LQLVLQRGMVQMLINDSSVNGLEKISEKMPATIEKALDFPVVKEVIHVAGEKSVLMYVEFELIKLSSRVSVGGNLTNAQVPFIAKELIKIFLNETLADFKLCFDRGAIGQYGEIFRLDGIVIRGWMDKYLEEKYQVIETQLLEAKEDMYKPVRQVDQGEKHQYWLDKMKEANAAIEARKVASVTKQDILKFGQSEPPKESYQIDHIRNLQINLQHEINHLAIEGYSHLKPVEKVDFRVFVIDGIYKVNCASMQDAEEIYRVAKERLKI
jgi:hypothetical protein